MAGRVVRGKTHLLFSLLHPHKPSNRRLQRPPSTSSASTSGATSSSAGPRSAPAARAVALAAVDAERGGAVVDRALLRSFTSMLADLGRSRLRLRLRSALSRRDRRLLRAARPLRPCAS